MNYNLHMVFIHPTNIHDSAYKIMTNLVTVVVDTKSYKKNTIM